MPVSLLLSRLLKAVSVFAAVISSNIAIYRPAVAAESVTFLLAAPPNLPAFAPLVLAKYLGYYSADGYDVEFQIARGGIDIAKNVGAGNAPFGLSLGDAPIVVRGSGIPIKVVAMMGGGALGVIVARKDRGIEKLDDLRGKKVSVMSFQEANYYAAVGALATRGIGKRDAEIEAVGPAGIISLVIAGSVDACVCTPDWEINVADSLGSVVAMPLRDYVPTTAQAIVASDDMIAKRPEFVRSIVRASLRGLKLIIDNPDAAAALYIKAVPSFADKEDLVRRILRNYVERTYKGQAILGETNPATLAALEKLYLEQGVVREAVPIESLYTNEFIR